MNVTGNAMATVKLNVEYDLLLQKTKLSSNIKERKNNNTIVQQTDHIYFVICNSCYWCASYFSVDNVESSSQVPRCHLCNSHNTELTPISSNESFRINYNVTRGMEMEFYRSNEIVNRQKSPEQQIVPPV
jgi:predicted Zn-ribbon and HTH transcriptional regulator